MINNQILTILNMSRTITKYGTWAWLLLIMPMSLSAQETIAPPSLGQQTQGATDTSTTEISDIEANQPIKASQTDADTDQSISSQFLGTTQISELRRESGQVYRIELEHSSGSKQTIDEFDSDGNIQSTNNDIEDTPNLAKWRLGSW